MAVKERFSGSFLCHVLTNIEYVSLNVDLAKGVGTFRAELDGSFTADVTVMPRTLPFTCKNKQIVIRFK